MENEEDFLKLLQEQLDKHVAEINSMSRAEMDNLSPNDMFQILYHTLENTSPIGYIHNIKPEILREIPFLKLVIEYLRHIIGDSAPDATDGIQSV